MKSQSLPSKKEILISLIIYAAITAIIILTAEHLGHENILSNMMLLIGAAVILKAEIREKPAKVFLWILIMNITCGVAASAVQVGLLLGTAVNLVVLFSQTMILYREKGMQVYFPFHLAYLYMMACSPVSLGNLGPRIMMLIGGSLLCLGTQAISYRWQVKKGLTVEGGGYNVKGYMTGILKDVNRDSVRFSFAFRRAVGVTGMWFVATLFDLEYGSWLILSVNALLLPYASDASEKLKARMAGCITGAALSFIVFETLNNENLEIAVAALAMYGIILFYSQYSIRYGCITVISLFVASLSDPSAPGFVIIKPVYVLIGGLVGIALDRFVFRCQR